MSDFKTRVVVLISGSGTNLQALIDSAEKGLLPVKICAVISNVDNVAGLDRATQHNIPAFVISHKSFASREAFDERLMEIIDSQGAELVVLAGFMRILTPAFTEHFAGKMLNIHPSLLPKYQGLNTHQRAIDAGDSIHGVSVHYVTADLDGGPVAIQASVAIEPEDDTSSLAAKVQAKEHLIYPLAVRWFAEGRLSYKDGKALFDGVELTESGLHFDDTMIESD